MDRLANEQKATLNPHLSNFANMIRTGRLYATLSSTHFVDAHKLVMEGGRRWMGEQYGTPLQLRENDIEGMLIQTIGVEAVVYRQGLWWDKKAQFALMQMGNLDAEMVWHQVVCSSVPRLMRPLRDLSPEEICRFFEAT